VRFLIGLGLAVRVCGVGDEHAIWQILPPLHRDGVECRRIVVPASRARAIPYEHWTVAHHANDGQWQGRGFGAGIPRVYCFGHEIIGVRHRQRPRPLP